MAVDTVEGALSELLALRDRWQRGGRTRSLAKAVQQKARELGSLSGLAASFSDEIAAAVERPEIPGPRTRIPERVGGVIEVDGEIDGLASMLAGDTPSAASPAALAASSELAPMAAKKKKTIDFGALLARESRAVMGELDRLPVRNQGQSNPGHVELFDQHDGLIHGGVVQARGFRVVCKAFRSFHCHSHKKVHRATDVVAGVCEQIADGDKRIGAPWSTAKRLQDRYASTAVKLPKGACRVKIGPGNLWRGIPVEISGFYRNSSWPRDLQAGFEAAAGKPVRRNPPGTPSGFVESDDGLPNAVLYAGKVVDAGKKSLSFASGFLRNPPPAESIENALYATLPEPAPGFVINTPYLSVFSPGPDSPSVLVAMVGAYREARLIGVSPKFRITDFEREAQWHVKIFS